MKRFFTLLLGALAMVAVALISAFIAMRLAIHGREAVVPRSPASPSPTPPSSPRIRGLQLNLENRFYSADVPAGRILAQDPEPGSRVRREWPIRITESLGAQRVNIPDLTGESERAATVSIRRLSLDLGVVAHLAVPGDPDVVLTQTPAANSGGVDGPRVSLLVSDSDDAQPPLTSCPRWSASATRRHRPRRHRRPPPRRRRRTPPAPATPRRSPAPAAGAPGPRRPSAPPPRSPRRRPPAAPSSPSLPSPAAASQQGDAVHVTLAHPAPPPAASPQ